MNVLLSVSNKIHNTAKEWGEEVKYFEPEWKYVSSSVQRSLGKLYPLYQHSSFFSLISCLFQDPIFKSRFTVTLNRKVLLQALVFNSVVVALLLLGLPFVTQSQHGLDIKQNFNTYFWKLKIHISVLHIYNCRNYDNGFEIEMQMCKLSLVFWKMTCPDRETIYTQRCQKHCQRVGFLSWDVFEF